MLLLSSALELLGVVLLGIPAIRLAQARFRMRRIINLFQSREPLLVASLLNAEKDELVWPDKIDVVLLIVGLAFAAFGIGIKCAYYGVDLMRTL